MLLEHLQQTRQKAPHDKKTASLACGRRKNYSNKPRAVR
jgi:hypothetical protein